MSILITRFLQHWLGAHKGMVVMQGWYDLWEHFYKHFVDGNEAVSLSPSWLSPTH